MWIEYNPNPCGIRVSDCAVRAVAKAFGDNWDTAFAKLSLEAFIACNMPSSDDVWGRILAKNGFKKKVIETECEDCYTADQFCNDHPEGTYVLAFGGHVATVVDGNLFDSWDSSNEVPIYYYELERNK